MLSYIRTSGDSILPRTATKMLIFLGMHNLQSFDQKNLRQLLDDDVEEFKSRATLYPLLIE